MPPTAVLPGLPRPPATSAILLIDDHPVVRAGLAAMLALSGWPLRVLEAPSVASAEPLLTAGTRVDLVMYDWHLPTGGGCKGLQRIRALAPGVPVLVVSADEDDAIGMAARQCGAAEFVAKSASVEVLHRSLAAQLPALQAAPQSPPPVADDPAAGGPEAAHQGAAGLSPRQCQVLRLVALGWTNKRIANHLSISDATVRAHVTDIFRALDVKNRTQAAMEATRRGLTGPDDAADDSPVV